MTMRAFHFHFHRKLRLRRPLNRPLVQLFDFQWLARPDAGSLFLLFTDSSRRRLFIDLRTDMPTVGGWPKITSRQPAVLLRP
jgi:hypothetical protein